MYTLKLYFNRIFDWNINLPKESSIILLVYDVTLTAIANIHPNPIYSCDVLIIGGGSAGLRAAIEAHDADLNVIIR